MLKHLWRSLIAVHRHARPAGYGTYLYKTSGLAVNRQFGVKIDDKTIKYNADGELRIDPYELQIALYKQQLNAFQAQRRESERNGQSVEALKAMVATLHQLLENTRSVVAR